MHELSLVMGIIELVELEAAERGAVIVEEIVLNIGELSGVEMSSFDFAWDQAVKDTILEGTNRIINRIPGKGKCLDCQTEFALHQYYDPCPDCGQHLIQVISGKEMKVKTLTLGIADCGLRIAD
jgi:hydrogenase nickel incorporation protein HypA/HybF